MSEKLAWEQLPYKEFKTPVSFDGRRCWRLKVPNGWVFMAANESAVCFIPDEKHEWKL